MDTVGKIEQAGFRHIAGLQATVRQLWVKMCEHDEIDHSAKFVVFSDDNPYRPFYDAALRELWEAQRNHVPGGGYVGLKIVKGKAVL